MSRMAVPMKRIVLTLGLLAGACRPATPTTSKPPAEPAYDGPDKRVLVELYSSQGCNSCPKADALLGEFPALGLPRDQVVTLTFHVTYWDDLGWQDPYARPLFDQRQIGYAQALPLASSDDETTLRGPYTPQMVVDGGVHFSGTLADVAKEQVALARRTPTPIELELAVGAPIAADSGTTLSARVTSRMAPDADFDTSTAKVALFAALAQRTLTTEVPRGENAGAQLNEHWVVRDFQGPKLFRSERETNDTPFTLTVPTDADPSEFEVVVFAQELASLHVAAVTTAAVPQ